MYEMHLYIRKYVHLSSLTPFLKLVSVLRDIQAAKRDTRAFQEAMFIGMLAVTQWIHIQSLSPENKEALPYVPLQADYRNPYMVTCNFISYFILSAM
jgi:hypothetical protein